MLTVPTFPDVVNIVIPILVALLTIPTVRHLLVRKGVLPRECEPVRGDVAETEYYQDRNGEATEASTKAFSDSRALITLWLGVIVNIEASLMIELVKHYDFRTTNEFSEEQLFPDTRPSWRGISLPVGSYSLQTHSPSRSDNSRSLTVLFRDSCFYKAPFCPQETATTRGFA